MPPTENQWQPKHSHLDDEAAHQAQPAFKFTTQHPPTLLLAAPRHPQPPRLLRDAQHLRRCRRAGAAPPPLPMGAAMTLAAKRGQASWRQSRSLAVGRNRAIWSSASSVMPSPSKQRARRRHWLAAIIVGLPAHQCRRGKVDLTAAGQLTALTGRPGISAAYVLKRDSATDITITQMFITLAIMLEVY